MTRTSLESAETMRQVDDLVEAIKEIKISGLDDDEYYRMEKYFSNEIPNLKIVTLGTL